MATEELKMRKLFAKLREDSDIKFDYINSKSKTGSEEIKARLATEKVSSRFKQFVRLFKKNEKKNKSLNTVDEIAKKHEYKRKEEGNKNDSLARTGMYDLEVVEAGKPHNNWLNLCPQELQHKSESKNSSLPVLHLGKMLHCSLPQVEEVSDEATFYQKFIATKCKTSTKPKSEEFIDCDELLCKEVDENDRNNESSLYRCASNDSFYPSTDGDEDEDKDKALRDLDEIILRAKQRKSEVQGKPSMTINDSIYPNVENLHGNFCFPIKYPITLSGSLLDLTCLSCDDDNKLLEGAYNGFTEGGWNASYRRASK